MKIIVDTNIIFSAILNTNSQIGDLILNSNKTFEFFSTSYLKEELEKHKDKLSQISKLSVEEIDLIKSQVFNKVEFITEEIVPFEYWKNAAELVRDVDMDDIAFVALSLFMDKSPIWTGDEQLRKGIINKGFKEILNTSEVLALRTELEKK